VAVIKALYDAAAVALARKLTMARQIIDRFAMSPAEP
jgi:hypothetical protein